MDLFGKKKLEERILELEAEKSRREGEREELLRTLEKRDEKIRKLSAAAQESNLALKAAEQRAAAAQSASSAAAEPQADEPQEQRPGGLKLGGRDTDLLLERLEAIRSPREDLLTACYPGTSPDTAALPQPLAEAVSAIKSRQGGIVLHCPQLFSFLLIPPFPIKESRCQEGASFNLNPIKEMMDTPVLVISAHAGDTFLGVSLCRDKFEAEEMVQSSVMGRHSKGGWSQKRFERLREEEVKAHMDLVNEKLQAMLGRYKPVLHYAVLSGEESLVRQIASFVDLPLVERRLSRIDCKETNLLLDEVYGFVCYRMDK